MSSFVYMKALESTPERYDRGMELLSRGRIRAVYERLAERVAEPGARVLDLGCGTGGVALACAARGARVVGVDVNPAMLEVARAKSAPPGAAPVEWIELGATELEDRFPAESFDAAVSCLALSELSPEERRYALRSLHRLLRPGGRLAVADEEEPTGRIARALHRVRRWPVELLTLLLAQSTTHAVPDLSGWVREAGFVDVQREVVGFRDLVIVTARRPEGRP